MIDSDDLLISLVGSLKNIPFHLHCKDKKGRYVDFNEQTLIDTGLSERADLRGLTDLDFSFLTNAEAQHIINRDKEIIVKGDTTIHTGRLTLHSKNAFEISIKNALKSKFSKKNIGIMTYAFMLYEKSTFYEKFIEQITHQFLYPKMTKKNCHHLSKREKECLELYLSGLSSKETAKSLGLSHRTVEEYIHNIKTKLNCNKKRDLIKLFSG